MTASVETEVAPPTVDDGGAPAQASPQPLPRRTGTRWALAAATSVVAAVVSAPWFALWPGQLVNLNNWATAEGYIRCAEAEGDLLVRSCESLGISAGSVRFETMVSLTMARLLRWATGIDAFTAYQIIGIVALALGFLGCFGLARHLLGRFWPGALVGLAYLLSPGVFHAPGLPHTLYGMFLLPCALWWSLALHERARRSWPGVGLLTVVVTASGLLLANVFSYSFLYYAVVLTVMIGVRAGLEAVSARRFGPLREAGAVVVGCAAAALTQRQLWPSGGVPDAPLDFFRGSSVDLLALLIPLPSNRLWGPLGLSIDTFDLSANLTRADGPFIGYATAALVVVAIVGAYRWTPPASPLRRNMPGLLVACGTMLVLLLGPTLRVNDPWPRQGPVVSYTDRLMPSSAGLVDLPWAWAYEMPGMSAARVVHRWQIPASLLLAVLAVAGIALLASRLGRRWPLVLVALAAVAFLGESIRNSISSFAETFEARYAFVHGFESDVVVPYRAALAGRERVLYLPASGNDYLAPALGPLIDVTTFNAAGDKTVRLARETYPQDVLELVLAYGGPAFSTDQLVATIADGTIGTAVLNDFSLLTSVYGWPADEQQVADLAAVADQVVAEIGDRCDVTDIGLGAVIDNCRPQ